MAYLYQTGTANDVPHWFSLLETFLVGRGWTVESGTGTTMVVFSSPGEGGGRTKLFIRFRRDSIALNAVWFRVQNDAAGTQATTESGSYVGYLNAPGVGAIPFVYFMAADKDKVIVNYKAGAGYSGGYVGIVEPFALTVEEEEQMVAIGLNMTWAARNGYVLKDSDGNWNQPIRSMQLDDTYLKDPLDNSVAVFALREEVLAYNKIVGQPTDVSGRINTLPGVNPEDIITTGYTGATSTWIVMGGGTVRWCMRTGGNVPVGQLEGAYFAHTNGLATSQADFESKLLTFMTAIGWTKIANPSPAYPIDYFFNCAGESGIDNIFLHWRYKTTEDRYELNVSDDTLLTHMTNYTTIPIVVGDFPTYYYLTGDRDCVLIILEVVGIHLWAWAGMWQMFMPDPDSYDTSYKVGNAGISHGILRAHDGTWEAGTQVMTDGFTNSSPNLFDGVTNVVWQYPVQYLNIPIGICKYVHRLSGAGLSVMDTAAIGGRSFRYFNTNLAFRES